MAKAKEQNKVYICPKCGEDITCYTEDKIKMYNKAKHTEKMRAKITPEKRRLMTLASQERLRKWREANPEKSRAIALKASAARNAETFKKQSETTRELAYLRDVELANRISDMKEQGKVITPEVLRNVRKKVYADVAAKRKKELAEKRK